MAWHAAVVRLREEFGATGWRRDDTANFSTIINENRTLKIAVANTDDATGNARVFPTNRSKKGALGKQAALLNQLALPFIGWRTEPDEAKIAGCSTWYLCLFINGETVRAELSRPTLIEKGYFADWSERLLLVDSDDGWRRVASPKIDNDDGPEFRVQVSRK
jgi:hypothetical protein